MVYKSLWLTLGQSFEHITLYTYNGAAIFYGAIRIPIYGVLPYSIIHTLLILFSMTEMLQTTIISITVIVILTAFISRI